MEDQDFSTIVRADLKDSFDDQDNGLRPQMLSDFLGQSGIKKNLSTFIEAAKLRSEPLDHLLLIGPPGLGKTTLAQITAHELGVDFKVTSAPALDKPKDLAGILSTITERTVFFIDEIRNHIATRLRHHIPTFVSGSQGLRPLGPLPPSAR